MAMETTQSLEKFLWHATDRLISCVDEREEGGPGVSVPGDGPRSCIRLLKFTYLQRPLILLSSPP